MHTIDLILLALGLGALALTLVGRVALGAFVPCCLAALAGYVGSYEDGAVAERDRCGRACVRQHGDRAPAGRAQHVMNVSVVIPAFNAASTIGAAIESVAAQSSADNIVVDDGSRDVRRRWRGRFSA